MNIRPLAVGLILTVAVTAVPSHADARTYTVFNYSDAAVWVDLEFGIYPVKGFCTNPHSQNAKDKAGEIVAIKIQHINCRNPVITERRFKYGTGSTQVYVHGHNGNYTITFSK